MSNTLRAILIILVCAVCTYLLRAFPFLLFGGKKEMPKIIRYLAYYLPPAIMATLVIYCIKDVANQGLYASIPMYVSVAITAVMHLWKSNTMLSITFGTVCYMILIRCM